MSERIFNENLLLKSKNSDLLSAIKEWKLKSAFIGKDSCICGKTPIKHICLMKNIHNNNVIIVGSSCVEKFFHIPTGKMFSDFAKVEKNILAKLDSFTIEFLFKNYLINSWEYEFYMNINKWRNLSEKQVNCLRKINERLIREMRGGFN